MTDEEMAEEYLQSIEGDDCVIITDREERKQAFLAGLKAGRPQWHDLRKDPNDLPPQSSLYWDVSERVLASHKIANNQYITNILRYSYVDKYWKSPESILYEGIIAWCKIPTFDKE